MSTITAATLNQIINEEHMRRRSADLIAVTGRCIVAPPMTAADLGIIDQNLDDKIGMEP